VTDQHRLEALARLHVYQCEMYPLFIVGEVADVDLRAPRSDRDELWVRASDVKALLEQVKP